MRRQICLLRAAVGMLALVASACGDGDPSPGAGTAGAEAGGAPGDLSGEVLVSAAASLTDAFAELGEALEADHPDVTVTFTFASSGTLSAQVREGAPVDVLASADGDDMTELAEEGLLAGEPEVFAANRLVIVTEPGNPEGIEGLEDLVDVGIVALCGEGAPCGRLAGEVLDGAGVAIPEDRITRGRDVRAALTAVADGDAVAGIVYLTDALAAGAAVEAVAIPPEAGATTTYPIGVLAGAGEPDVAQAFVDLVTSERGLGVLEAHGFEAPG